MPADSTVSDLEQLHKQARAARSRYEPDWYLNLSFYTGDQWLAFAGGRLYRPGMPKNKITVVDNRIQPCVRTEIARMTKNDPVFTVLPRSSDEEDSNAAQLGDEVMKYLWKHLNLRELTMKALHWSRICGAGFLKCYWDSTIGDSQEVLVGQSGNVLTHPQSGQVLRPGMLPEMPNTAVKTIRQGDIRVEARSPFQMFIDPLADSFSEAEWLIEESVKSAGYVERRYGVKLQPDTPANPGLVESRLGASLSTSSSSYRGVKVCEYWSKPSTEHPQGRRAVWSPKQNKMLTEGVPFDPMPYVMLSGIPIPGRMWPTSVAEQLRGPQTELNKVKSQIAENRNRVGNPTLLASRQATGDPEKFLDSTTRPGGTIFYDDVGSPNAVPKFLEAPPLPEYVVDEIQRIEESIQEISGQHEVTSAQVPPGVTAASAIQLLLESDDTRLGPAMRDYEFQLGALGQKLLGLVARYYTDARTIRLSGENGSWQIYDFRGSMLRNNTSVEVQGGSTFPQSKAAKQAGAQDILNYMAQSGQPLQGRQLFQFLQDWGVGGVDKLIADFTADETQVNRENVQMSQGEALKINAYDNDDAHIAGHEDFQKASRYQQLNPRVQQLFEQHVAEHRERAGQEQQQQMLQQAQAEGKAPPDPQQEQESHQQELAGGQQDQDIQAAQAQQDMQDQASQQGLQQAEAEQKQRQAEEAHHQKLRQGEERHQLDARRGEERHQADLLKAQEQQAQQEQQTQIQALQAQQQARLKERQAKAQAKDKQPEKRKPA